MLKNDYEYLNKHGFTIYYSLNDFINDYKQYYNNTLNEKIRYYENEHLNPYFETFTFNDIFHNFINVYLHEWKIGKYENVSLYKYDDTIIVYTKNNCFSYVFYE